jgi:8-oxo-dGTP pyrophosphatase MutT (NUDIX family)
VVVARGDGADAEVLLLRRTAKAAFMARAWVYPGGRVDADDQSDAWSSHVQGIEVLEGAFDDLDARTARAFFIAAIRECFEESGLLLAHRRDGRHLAATPAQRARLSEWRRRLNARDAGLLDLVREESLVVRLDAIAAFAHWVTPANEPRRYDTRFFLAPAPAGQVPIADCDETVAERWVRPADALREHAAGQLHLAPPTWHTLMALAEAAPALGLFAWASREVPTTIEPVFAQDNNELCLLLPGDADYPSHRPVAGATRIALRDGAWHEVGDRARRVPGT